MELSELRDLVLVIFGFLGIGATLLFISLLVIIYRKVMPIINSAKKTAANVRDTSSFVAENVIRPVAKVQGFISGMRKAAEFISTLRRKEEKKDGKQ